MALFNAYGVDVQTLINSDTNIWLKIIVTFLELGNLELRLGWLGGGASTMISALGLHNPKSGAASTVTRDWNSQIIRVH